MRNTRGGVAIIVAVAIPVLALLACGTLDLASLGADRAAMQDAADASALATAKQLGIGDPASIAQRAKAYAAVQLVDVSRRVTTTTAATISAKGDSVTVSIDGRRASFFANLLPPGGWKIHVEATAATLGRVPLCVLSSDGVKHGLVILNNTSRMTATSCLVQSNGDIQVKSSSQIVAGMVQSTGVASGYISPTPQQGAPPIADPFTSMNLAAPLPLCVPVDVILAVGAHVLPPGTHCGSIRADKGVTLTLLPGEHYFMKGSLELSQNAVLTGKDVTLIFDKQSDFKFDDQSAITLEGRTSGAFAGFVIATSRDNTHTFEISSDSASKLLGTIYIPNATLQVTGAGNKVAEESAWTVVVAKSIELIGSPNLIINANYAGSTVPVPQGVGPRSSQVTLQR